MVGGSPRAGAAPGGSPTRAVGSGGRGQRGSLMNVGRRVDYAVRALSYLAAQPPNRLVPRTEIQERQHIPPHFLSKILRLLVTGGLLTSASGARGGFRLGRAAHAISLRSVYESVEGPLSLIECLDHRDGFCGFVGVCKQVDVWTGAQHALRSYLDGVSIGDIADPHGMVPQRASGTAESRTNARST